MSVKVKIVFSLLFLFVDEGCSRYQNELPFTRIATKEPR